MASVPAIIICLVIGLNRSASPESHTENTSSLLAPFSSLVHDDVTRDTESSRHEHVSSVNMYQTSTIQQDSSENQRHEDLSEKTSLRTSILSSSANSEVKSTQMPDVQTSVNEQILSNALDNETEISTRPFPEASKDKENDNYTTANTNAVSQSAIDWISPASSLITSTMNMQKITMQHATTVSPENPMASSDFNETDRLCSPKTITTVNATSWTVAWTQDYRSCVKEYNWVFVVPQGYACVAEFHHVDMQAKDTLLLIVYTESTHFTIKTFNKTNQESLAPKMLPFKTITLKVITSLKSGFSSISSFNVSFTTHMNNSVPLIQHFKPHQLRESYFTYICTGFVTLPKAIMCDGIRHCQHGEDEVGCDYSKEGCGTWFPYNDFCLKAKFRSDPTHNCGYAVTSAPVNAETTCRSEYNASLALLWDTTGIQIAANLIRKSGFLNAVVGIKKYRPVSMKTRHLYRFLWQWGDSGSSIAYEQQILQRSGTMNDCGALFISPKPFIQSVSCSSPQFRLDGYICMRPKSSWSPQTRKPSGINFLQPTKVPDQFPTKQCPDGSVVQTFHQCQWGQSDTDQSLGWSPGNLPLFQCRTGPAVHFSLLCDGNDDCADRSDEMGCHKPQFSPLLDSSFVCRKIQTVAAKQRCNGMPDCSDSSDEEYCAKCSGNFFCREAGCLPSYYTPLFDTCPFTYPNPKFLPTLYTTGSVELDGYGMSVLNSVSVKCPEGFYGCLNGLCIPTFLMHNGEKDCIHGEDEDIPVHDTMCPGYYRCKGVGSCVHKNYLCDGIYHCPDKDDEMFCDLICPQDRGCVCEGHAFTCSKMINPLQHIHVRYLDLNHASDVSFENIHVMEYLFFLNLSFCSLSNVTLRNMHHLQTLDLSYNYLMVTDSIHLHKLTGLLYLILSNNPIGKTLSSVLNTLMRSGELRELKTLILTNTTLEKIPGRMFHSLTKLKYLDLRNNPLHNYNKESLSGLYALEFLFTDESKLCCSYFHSSPTECNAPVDELSSCDDLLGQNFFRVFLWTVSVLSIVGNAGVLIYRFITDANISISASRILLKNLCVSDFLMGIYLVMIGVADIMFQGNYVAKEAEWTNSKACTIAGCLSFVSSEVSTFLICVITLDRVIVICFPFKRNFHLSSRSTIIICCMIWVLGVTLAVVPLISGMEFYGLNGICLPLPITRQPYTGQNFAFGIFIILNFIIFLFISVAQFLIYRAIHKTKTASGNLEQRTNVIIARRLFLIIFTDFCCWFPVGVMGLLAVHGTPIPGKLNVWTVIFVLPINSALNPFLYTLNGLVAQWKKRKMVAKEQRIVGRLQTEIYEWQPSAVQQLARVCIMSKKVEKDILQRYVDSVNSLRPLSLEPSSNDNETRQESLALESCSGLN